MKELELLQKLISFHSVTSDMASVNRLQDYLTDFLEKEGLFCSVEIDPEGRKTLFAATEKNKTPDLLLNAHVDVVPPIDPKQFTPEIRNGKIFARGTDDCLGNAVCMADVLIRSKGKASVGAVFTSDEEVGGATTALMVERGYGAKKAIVILDCNINDGITIAQKGIAVVRLTAHGNGGHASAPWMFDNPVDKLVRGYAKLLDVWKNPSPSDTWNNSMAACVVSGGNVHNQIPDEASITLNFRFVHDGDEERILGMVRSVTGLDAELEMFSPCVSFPEDGSAMKLLREVASKHFSGREIRFHRMDGATDARHMKKLNIPLAVMGIRGDGAHSVREYAEIDSIGLYAAMLSDYAEQL